MALMAIGVWRFLLYLLWIRLSNGPKLDWIFWKIICDISVCIISTAFGEFELPLQHRQLEHQPAIYSVKCWTSFFLSEPKILCFIIVGCWLFEVSQEVDWVSFCKVYLHWLLLYQNDNSLVCITKQRERERVLESMKMNKSNK